MFFDALISRFQFYFGLLFFFTVTNTFSFNFLQHSYGSTIKMLTAQTEYDFRGQRINSPHQAKLGEEKTSLGFLSTSRRKAPKSFKKKITYVQQTGFGQIHIVSTLLTLLIYCYMFKKNSSLISFPISYLNYSLPIWSIPILGRILVETT